jgi:adenine-specific DNA-methyltransferase
LSVSTTPARADPPGRPFNAAPQAPFARKYIGSKRLLRAWIGERICARAGGEPGGTPPVSFLDGFCGTASIAVEMAGRGTRRIVAVDSLLSNCVILRGCSAATGIREERAARLLCGLNGLPPSAGYIAESFAGTYFTVENCARMDAIREAIAADRAEGRISSAEHDYLLGSFLLAADRVANTLGQYDAFLKNIGSASVVGGRHVRDARVSSDFQLRPLAPLEGADIEAIEGDMLALAPTIDVEVAYYDPPYNGRQYCDNYHVLENIARWEKPPLSGKTRKFDRTGLRSPFCRKAEALGALRALVRRTSAPHLFLSYSSEGILSRESILASLSEHGRVQAWELAYPVFGNGAGVSRRRSLAEWLFHLTRE